MLEGPARTKHSSLLRTFVTDIKNFMTFGPGRLIAQEPEVIEATGAAEIRPGILQNQGHVRFWVSRLFIEKH
jgi:hypothetical protein